MPKNKLRLLNGIMTLAALAVLGFLVVSSSMIAEQSNGTGPVRSNEPRGRDATNSGVPQVRPRSVYREIVRRINIADGVLALPVVAYYGVPVILDVPGVGLVDVPEDEYARLFDKLSSSAPEQMQEAMSSLRRLKEQEEAEVAAARRRPERAEPDDTRDLSEPIFFDSPSRSETRRGRPH
jgi:hypothetical protein